MRRRVVLLGSRGILGTGFRACLPEQVADVLTPEMPWGDPAAVTRQVKDVLAAQSEPVDVIWAAGTGRISAEGSEMAVETHTISQITDLLAGQDGKGVKTFFFASSAGALFGGHGGGIIDDSSVPSPVTAYGVEKLRQEAIVAGLSTAGQCRAVIGRFSNIFGLADGYLRPKGLISVIVRTTLTSQSASVFVNPDTRRDYLFATDAARMSLALMDAGEPTTRIINQGSTLTVLDIIEHVSRVTRRRVPVTFRETPESSLQPLTLAFAPRTGVLANVATASFPAAIRVVAEGRLTP